MKRFGCYVGLGEPEVRWTEAWFAKYGDAGNLIGHALPGVRSFTSFLAGIARMGVRRYVSFTALGSGIWNVALALAGFYLLTGWFAFAQGAEGIDLVLLLAAITVALGYIHWRKRVSGVRETASPSPPPK